MTGNTDLLAFGAGAYYVQSGPLPRKERDPSHYQRLLQILLGIDAEQEVNRARQQWNPGIRDAIRAATALRLADEAERISVPVEVSDGLPEPFGRVVQEFDESAWWLAVNRPMLERTREGLVRLHEGGDRVVAALGLTGLYPAIFRGNVKGTQRVVDDLLRLERVQQLENRLRAIDVDVLGAYFPSKPCIQLYWMVIGAYARIMGVEIADLTAVVLCHELAHAYTHLGRDIDGRQWHSAAFTASNKYIVEGLAQYYTRLVMRDLAPRLPGGLPAFEALLKRQPTAYTVFQTWFGQNDGRAAEIVRSAMLEYRRGEARPYSVFQDMLKKEQGRLHR